MQKLDGLPVKPKDARTSKTEQSEEAAEVLTYENLGIAVVDLPKYYNRMKLRNNAFKKEFQVNKHINKIIVIIISRKRCFKFNLHELMMS